jgi:hypothetical protein
MTVDLPDTAPGDRRTLHDLVTGIEPVDDREAADRADVLAWIAGAYPAPRYALPVLAFTDPGAGASA